MDKKTIMSLVMVGVLLVSAFAVVVLPAASPCGEVHGAFANLNGNFGFLGPLGGTPGYHGGAVGQMPGATGANNSGTGCQGT